MQGHLSPFYSFDLSDLERMEMEGKKMLKVNPLERQMPFGMVLVKRCWLYYCLRD